MGRVNRDYRVSRDYLDYEGNEYFRYRDLVVTGNKAVEKHKREIKDFYNKLYGSKRGGDSPHAYKKLHGDYISSYGWKKKRQEHLDFLRYHRIPEYCMGCGVDENLQLHHLTYKRLGREKPWDLVLLCNSCHNKVHAFEAQCRPNFEDRFYVRKDKVDKVDHEAYALVDRKDVIKITRLVLKDINLEKRVLGYTRYRKFWRRPGKHLEEKYSNKKDPKSISEKQRKTEWLLRRANNVFIHCGKRKSFTIKNAHRRLCDYGYIKGDKKNILGKLECDIPWVEKKVGLKEPTKKRSKSRSNAPDFPSELLPPGAMDHMKAIAKEEIT